MRRITFGSSMSATNSRRLPPRGHARTSKPKLRCISSAHSQFVRDGIGVVRDDDVASILHWPAVTRISGLRACDQLLDRDGITGR
jgi:hypothetical protein